jgi:hypothetical protein
MGGSIVGCKTSEVLETSEVWLTSTRVRDETFKVFKTSVDRDIQDEAGANFGDVAEIDEPEFTALGIIAHVLRCQRGKRGRRRFG